MVLDAVHKDRFAVDVLQNTGHVSVELCSNFLSPEKWYAVFGAVGDVLDIRARDCGIAREWLLRLYEAWPAYFPRFPGLRSFLACPGLACPRPLA
jgi:hypothetical protein